MCASIYTHSCLSFFVYLMWQRTECNQQQTIETKIVCTKEKQIHHREEQSTSSASDIYIN